MKKNFLKIFSFTIIFCILLITINITNKDENFVLSAIRSTENDFTYNTEKLQELSSEESVLIYYPKFTNKSKESKKLNTIVKNELLNHLKLYGTDFENLTININYEIVILNNYFVSIALFGESNNLNSAHPNNIFFSINYSLDKDKKVSLKDLVKINDSFVKLLLEFSNNENPKVINDHLNKIKNEDFIKILKEEDLKFTVSTRNICIVLDLPHALGDFAKITIPIEQID